MQTKALQETFDEVVIGIRRQGRKAVEAIGGGCSYRTIDGLRCAAGMLIPDEFYSTSMEGRIVAGNHEVEQVLLRAGHDLGLVGQLQYCHDTPYRGEHFMEDFLKLATEVAGKSGLDPSACTRDL